MLKHSLGPLSHLFLWSALAIGMATPGCTSNCRSHCPATELDVFASPAENLGVAGATWTGPACRPTIQYCLPDNDRPDLYPCVGFAIVGFAQGTCDVALTFNDGRPATTIHAEFGPALSGCCEGFPLMGTTPFIFPPLHPDGGTDAADDAATDGPADATANGDAAGDTGG